MTHRFRLAASLAAPLGALAILLLTAGASHAAPAVIAIPDIGFTDSSGEPRDQKAEHAARLQALTQGLRKDIDGTKLESLALSCDGACRLDEAGVDALRRRAREAGAAYVLVGNVHKMSTLVMSMRLAVLDTSTGKLVLERLLSFRGDNDEGWRHMGVFVARDVAEKLGTPPQ